MTLYKENLGNCSSVSSSEIGYFSDCIISGTNFSNFAFEVQMTITQGDCGGILFRADISSNKYYYYQVCQSGSFRLSQYVDSKGADAKGIVGVTSTSINTGLGQSNTIAVVADNSDISLYVNNQQLYQTQDSGYSEGQLALFANATTGTTKVSFSNARVWTL